MEQTNNGANEPAANAASVESLQTQLAAANQVIAQKEALIAQRDATIADLQKQVGEKDSVIDEQNGQIGTLDAELDTLRANPPKTASFKHGKDHYAVTAPKFKMSVEGELREITAEQVLKDTKLQALLVKKGAGIITKLEH